LSFLPLPPFVCCCSCRGFMCPSGFYNNFPISWLGSFPPFMSSFFEQFPTQAQFPRFQSLHSFLPHCPLKNLIMLEYFLSFPFEHAFFFRSNFFRVFELPSFFFFDLSFLFESCVVSFSMAPLNGYFLEQVPASNAIFRSFEILFFFLLPTPPL